MADRSLRDLERAALARLDDAGAFEGYLGALERTGDRWRRLAGLSALARAGSTLAAATVHRPRPRRTGPPCESWAVQHDMPPGAVACVGRLAVGRAHLVASVWREGRGQQGELVCLADDLTESWRLAADLGGVAFACVEDRVVVASAGALALYDAITGVRHGAAAVEDVGLLRLAGDRVVLGRLRPTPHLDVVPLGPDGFEPLRRIDVRAPVTSAAAYGDRLFVSSSEGVGAHSLETGAELWWQSPTRRRRAASAEPVSRSVDAVDERVFVSCRRSDGKERVEVRDVTTGDLLWDVPLREAYSVHPVDDERLACLTGTSLVLRRRATGEKLASFKVERETSTIAGDVLLTLGERQRLDVVRATSLRDGALLWRAELPFEEEPLPEQVGIAALDDTVVVVARLHRFHGPFHSACLALT